MEVCCGDDVVGESCKGASSIPRSEKNGRPEGTPAPDLARSFGLIGSDGALAPPLTTSELKACA